MSNYHINILPEINKILLPCENIVNQDVGQQTITYTQGYGQLSKAGATVQLGVTGHINIDLTIESLSENFYKDVTKEIKKTCSSSITQELEEESEKKDYRNWWFAFLAGSSKDSHDSSYYRRQQNNIVNIDDKNRFKSVTKKMSSNKQNFHVTGQFDIVGTSYVSTTVFLFIETLNIQLSDGTTMVIPTQNTAVADANGNVGGGSTKSKLTILPL